MAQQRHKIYATNLDINQAAPNEGLVDIFDGYIDSYGVLRKRHGLETISEVFNQKENQVGYQGIFFWKEKNLVISVINGEVYRNISEGELTKVSGDVTLTPGKISFATNGSWLFIASTGGGEGVVMSGTSDAEYISTNDAIVPKSINSVSDLDGYILASETNTKRVWYTKTPDIDETVRPEFDQYFSAMGTPGKVLGVFTINREIYVVKTDSIEIWFNNGVTPFIRYEGAVIETNCLTDTSIAIVNEEIWFLTSEGFVSRLIGRRVEKVSVTIDSRIRKILRKYDCRIFQIDVFVVVTFLQEDITYVFDLINNKWYQWGYFLGEEFRYEAYLGVCACFARDSEIWLVGCRVKEHKTAIMKYKRFFNKDGENIIRFAVRSAFLDFGTYRNKRSTRLSIKIVVDEVIPNLQFIPPAYRCVFYTHTYSTPDYTVTNVTGLPAGFSYNSASETISGTAGSIFSASIKVSITTKTGEKLTYDDVLRVLETGEDWEISI